MQTVQWKLGGVLNDQGKALNDRARNLYDGVFREKKQYAKFANQRLGKEIAITSWPQNTNHKPQAQKIGRRTVLPQAADLPCSRSTVRDKNNYYAADIKTDRPGTSGVRDKDDPQLFTWKDPETGNVGNVNAGNAGNAGNEKT